jgi:hypothetical protein
MVRVEVGGKAGGLRVEEALEVCLQGALAALEIEPDRAGFVFVGTVSDAGRGGGAAVEEHAVDVAGEGGRRCFCSS